MLKNISNLGMLLSKKDQKKLVGGCGETERCEPWDHVDSTTCIYPGGYIITHSGCGGCFGGDVSSTTC